MKILIFIITCISLMPMVANADAPPDLDVSCNQFDLARIYIGVNKGGRPYYDSLERLKDFAKTKTESIDSDWVQELCEFIFRNEFSYNEFDQDSKNNFILVELLTESGSHAILSTDGEYLYYNGTYSAKIDDKFLSAFNFGGTALEIQYGY